MFVNLLRNSIFIFRVDNTDPGCDDRIELKVYGITCPGLQITHDLVELLDRKLVTLFTVNIWTQGLIFQHLSGIQVAFNHAKINLNTKKII